jgi:hypothetical protein
MIGISDRSQAISSRAESGTPRLFRLARLLVAVWVLPGTQGAAVAAPTPDTPCPSSRPSPWTCGDSGELGRAAGVAAPATTADPVYLRYGSVIETHSGLVVPGPAFPWAQGGTYNSQVSGAPSLGGKWLSRVGDMKLYDAGGGNVAVIVDATSQRVFRHAGGGRYIPPAGAALSLEQYRDGTEGYFKLTNTATDDVYIFHDFAGPYRGLLRERTTRQWQAAGKEGIRYTYHDDGRIKQATTPEGQDYNLVFFYSGSGTRTRIQKIEVREPDSTVIQRIEYTYYTAGVHSPDVGSQDDLVQVETFELDEEGLWTTHCTQYRYDAVSGHLKAVFDSDALERTVAERSDVSAAADILTKEDEADDLGSGSEAQQSRKIMAYASRWFTYYTGDLKTDNSGVGTPQDPKCVTLWAPGGEDLEGTYGGANVVEVDPQKNTHLVKTQIVRGPVYEKHEFFHLKIDQGPTPGDNHVVCLVIEDTADLDGKPLYRRIYGLNDSGRLLREVRITDPIGTPQFSCESRTFLDETGPRRHRMKDYRTPTAHNVSSNADLRKFLNPTGNGGLNDTDTLHDDAGEIYVYDYDSEGHPTGQKLKTGRLGKLSDVPAPQP